MIRGFRTECIVIKRRNIGETDRLLTVFTSDLGKIQVKATGVRKTASRRAPHIELLNHVSIGLYKAHGTPILTEAHMLEDYEGIKKDLGRIGFAYHLCELIDGLLPENQIHPEIYELFKAALKNLANANDIAPVIHDFEIDLLQTLGFWNKKDDTQSLVQLNNYIESILERKLKSRQVILEIRKNTNY